MNRRRLFSLFPLSLLGLAASAKAESSEPSIWVEHVCECRFGADGEMVLEPLPPHASRLSLTEGEYREDLEAWNSAHICGQRFRHLVGAHVDCPSCGEPSYNYKAAKGIPC
jgi:hypothetical protein